MLASGRRVSYLGGPPWGHICTTCEIGTFPEQTCHCCQHSCLRVEIFSRVEPWQLQPLHHLLPRVEICMPTSGGSKEEGRMMIGMRTQGTMETMICQWWKEKEQGCPEEEVDPQGEGLSTPTATPSTVAAFRAIACQKFLCLFSSKP